MAFTPQGVFLLEVNLSCNFFKGSFDENAYHHLVHQYWLDLDHIDLYRNKQQQEIDESEEGDEGEGDERGEEEDEEDDSEGEGVDVNRKDDKVKWR